MSQPKRSPLPWFFLASLAVGAAFVWMLSGPGKQEPSQAVASPSSAIEIKYGANTRIGVPVAPIKLTPAEEAARLAAKPIDGNDLTALDLSRPPTGAELAAAGNLGEPLTPTGPVQPIDGESPAAKAARDADHLKFGHAIDAWNAHRYPEAIALFKEHLMAFPDSPWAAESQLHLGCAAQYHGIYNEAAIWFDAILDAHPDTSLMAQKALLRRAVLHLDQAEFDKAEAAFAKLRRTAIHPDHRTYASYWLREITLLRGAETALRDCGQKALARVAELQDQPDKAATLRALPAAGPHGFTARELLDLAAKHDLPATALHAAARHRDLPLPWIAHYTDRHFVTVEAINAEFATIHDSRVGKSHQISTSSFLGQWSGVAVVFENDSAEIVGTAPVSDLDAIAGGCCGFPRLIAQLGDDPCAKKNCGLPGWSVNEVNMNFRVQDTPMWWNPPVGPPVHISLLFNSQDSLNAFEPFGPKWAFSYASYILIDPSGGATVRDGDGRFEAFTPPASGTYPKTYTSSPGDFRTLVETASHTFTLTHEDGTIHRFGIAGLMQGTSHVPLLLEIEDRHGNKVMIDHNAQGSILSIRHSALPPTQQWTLVYDENLPVSRVKRIDDPFGRSCHFSYDAQHRLTGQTDMGGLAYSYGYVVKDTEGVNDEPGSYPPGVLPAITSETYIESITTPKGTTNIRTEPADGIFNNFNVYPDPGEPMWSSHRITITDTAGFKQEYHYDGTQKSYYRGAAMMALSLGPNDETLPPTQTPHVVARLSFVKGKGKIWERALRAENGNTAPLHTVDQWDTTLPLPAQSTTPEGTTETIYHTSGPAMGLPSEIRLPKYEPGNTDYKITFTYSGREVATVKRHLAGVEKTLAAFTWYANRDLHTATDALGRTLTYEWNADGRPKKVTDGTTGDILEIFYHATTLRPETIKLNGTTLQSATHDAMGRVLSQTGPDGGVSEFTYDALDRLTSATGSDGLTTRWFWACCFIEEIRRTKTTAGQERVLDRVRYTHDPRGLVTSTIDTAGSRLQYSHDAGGNLATLTDAAGKTTTWEHDEFGRLRRKTYPDLTYEEYEYFTIHSTAPWTSVNRRGQTTIISRDAEEKPTSIDAGGAEIIDLEYDTWNRLQSVTQTGGELAGTHTFAYDILGRTTSIDGPWTGDDDKLTWTYNDATRQVTRTATGAEGTYSETATSDAFGRIASMLNPLGTFTWNYTGTDPRPGGITHSGGFNTEFSYDTLANGGRLTELISKLPGGATIAKHGYTHDTLGQIATWKREAPLANPGTTHQYEWTLAHDFSGQLTSVIEKDLSGGLRDSWAFGYDAAGNRSSATRSGAPGATAKAMTARHNTMNQITTLGGGGRTVIAGSLNEPGQVSVGLAGQTSKPARMLAGNRFESDLDLPAGTSTLEITANDPTGNTTSKQYSVVTAPETARTTTHDADGNMTSDGERSYEWDTWSRLTKITWATGKTTSFHYNALGQRSKLVHTDGGITRTEYLLYDGAELLQRRTNGTAASNTDRVYFSQGERRKVGSTWTNHHYTRDHLGSVREVLDASGALLARYDYAPYGERQTRYEASGYDGTDFGFTGHFILPSPVTGQSEIVLAHYRAYDPVLGRWLSQDPIRESGGINLYGYVGGDVAGAVDPLGLVCFLPFDILTDEQKESIRNYFRGMGQALVEDLKDPMNWAALGGLRGGIRGIKPRVVPRPPVPPPPPMKPGRNGAFNEAKRDAGIDRAQHPDGVRSVPMTEPCGKAILGKDGKPIMTREYDFTRKDGVKIVIQEHSAGHAKGELGPHFNVRPPGDTRKGTVEGTKAHYEFDK